MSRAARSLVAAAALCAGAAHAQAVDATHGQEVFDARCAVCHQAGGAGMDGLAPPLTTLPAHFAATPPGRDHLLHTVLDGMVGAIQVDGSDYNFKMPGFRDLGAADLAAVLNYLVFAVDKAPAGKIAPFDAAQVDAASKTSSTPDAVHAARAALAGDAAH